MNDPLRIEIDRRSGVPFYRQIIDLILLAIADGRLATGDQLPTVRQLAVDLRLNPNTVARAYRDLETVGVLETRRGDGTYVASRTPRLPEVERRKQLDRICREMVSRAQSLGFAIEELIETFKELRYDGGDDGDDEAFERPSGKEGRAR